MLENIFLPILLGSLTLVLIIAIICLFDDVWEFLSIVILTPFTWLLGKVVLLLANHLF